MPHRRLIRSITITACLVLLAAGCTLAAVAVVAARVDPTVKWPCG